MYGIINKGFGVLICDHGENLRRELFPFIRDLAALDIGSEAEDMPEFELGEFVDECIGDAPYGWTAYSGGDRYPVAIGFELDSWGYFEAAKIAESARKTENPRHLLERWNSEVPKEVRDLLKKHGLEPDVFWTSSTS